MKEILTVELELDELKDAVSNYLKEKGYAAKSFSFLYKRQTNSVEGISVVVTKEEENK